MMFPKISPSPLSSPNDPGWEDFDFDALEDLA